MSGTALSTFKPSNFWYATNWYTAADSEVSFTPITHLKTPNKSQYSHVLTNLLLSLGSNNQVNCIKTM